MCVKPWALKSLHWCAVVSLTYWDMHQAQLQIPVQLLGELKCRIGTSGFQNTQEIEGVGALIMLKEFIFICWLQQSIIALISTQWLQQHQAENDFSSNGQHVDWKFKFCFILSVFFFSFLHRVAATANNNKLPTPQEQPPKHSGQAQRTRASSEHARCYKGNKDWEAEKKLVEHTGSQSWDEPVKGWDGPKRETGSAPGIWHIKGEML